MEWQRTPKRPNERLLYSRNKVEGYYNPKTKKRGLFARPKLPPKLKIWWEEAKLMEPLRYNMTREQYEQLYLKGFEMPDVYRKAIMGIDPVQYRKEYLGTFEPEPWKPPEIDYWITLNGSYVKVSRAQFEFYNQPRKLVFSPGGGGFRYL